MSIVIIGGNERMECQYKEICKSYNCKAKVFTKNSGSFKARIGEPDVMILFTNTVSHKMAISALSNGNSDKTKIVRSKSSSSVALKEILENIIN